MAPEVPPASMGTANTSFWVIGIGASAGGLEALTTFFNSVPEAAGQNACFIVAQHLAPHAKSMMVELIGRQTALPVVSATSGAALEPGKVFIVPPNFDISISDRKLHLTEAGIETRPKPSVDSFFRSLAVAFGARAVGIILSGTGSDGALGVKEVKGFGGHVFVQDSESAKYDGMPKSSYETGLVDAMLPADQLGVRLLDLLNIPASSKSTNPDDESFRPILDELKLSLNLDFTQYKSATVFRRIEKRMVALGLRSPTDYLAKLKSTPAEAEALSRELLISVTSFFRDPENFDSLRVQIAKRLENCADDKEFRIWVAGCATGQEAYSLLMLVNELAMSSGQKNLVIKVFATDLDQNALSIARSGVYPIIEIDSIPESYRRPYLDLRGGHFEIKKAFREQVIFARQDIIQNPPFVKVDIISCRNVLIYFDSHLQAKVMNIFHYALKPAALLFLGKSESVQSDLFSILDKKSKIFQKEESAFRGIPTFSSPRSQQTRGLLVPTANAAANELFNIGIRRVLKASGFAGAVIDEAAEVEQFIGDVARYIEFPEGRPDNRLSMLLGTRAGVELGILIKKALASGVAERSRIHRAKDDDTKSFTFSVEELSAVSGHSRRLLLVTFEPRTTAKTRGPISKNSHNSASDPLRILELEQEIAATREHLQTVVEELEVSNEELQSLNEEMSSTNEELQASNEELETTNEEMQSTNEELTTLNEELVTKSSELRNANIALENVQSSIGSPLVVVDSQLRVQRYNSSSSEIFSFAPSDLHRSVLDVSCHAEIPELEDFLRSAISAGQTNEGLCYSGRRIYQMRVHPFRDEHKKITGAVLTFFDNTDFITLQEKLKASDNRIRAIINGSPTLISLKDTTGKYLTVNDSFLQQFGLEELSVLGKTDREIFDATTATQFHDRDLEVILRRTPTAIEEQIVIKGVSRHFLSSRFALFSGPESSPFAVGTVSLDITAQINAQEELVKSQARYRAIVEDQAVFVARLNPTGRITFVNQAFCSYFGGSPESNGSKHFNDVIDRRDLKKFSTELASISFDMQIMQVEHRVQPGATGPTRWVRWILRGIFDDEGALTEFQAVGFDVTEVHVRTADLLEKENLFTHVLEHTSDYLSVFRHESGEFILESINQSAGRAKGLDQGRFVGQSLEDFLDPGRADFVLRRYRESIESQESVTFEEVVESPGGVRHLSTTLVPVRDSSEKSDKIVALSRDITRLKRVETALRDEKEKADLANRTKSDFLASMSHELRTPLNVITGMSQLLAMAELSDHQKTLVSGIQRSSKTLLSLVEDVLDLSKIEAGKVMLEEHPFSMRNLANEIIQTFAVQAKERGNTVKLKFELDPDQNLLGDVGRIRQVIANLLSNAIKFTHDGSITLTFAGREGGENHMHTIYIEVRDTGIGIPFEARSKLFQRFSQVDSGTSRKYGGTGLGLVISKQIVELMHGSIGVESVPDQGSTFWFTIKLAETSRHVKAKSDGPLRIEESPIGELAQLNVLAVDDNPDNLVALKMYLEDRGAHVMTSDNGLHALEAVKSNNVHIVLMDVQMPGMDGLETARQIRKLPTIKSDVPIIAVTANAMADDPVKCREAGMDDYISKPISFDALSKVIASHADWGRANLQLSEDSALRTAHKAENIDGKR